MSKPGKLLLTFLLFHCIFFLHAQTNPVKKISSVNFSGFIDVFYCFDFNKPVTSFRQPFLYNHNRHNEFNLNLGLIKMSVEHEKYRGNIALQTGTYALDNYAPEKSVLKNIFEANAGISLDKTNKLWFDAGIFSSHIGFESAISSDDWTLTRSILAENSPYFLSGAKLTYTPSDTWQYAALIYNGWQRIQRVPGNSLPSFGTQVSRTNGERFTLNFSTFIGTDDPDSTRRMRYFSNLFGKFQGTKFGFIAGFDFGMLQTRKASSHYDNWFSPVLIVRYSINEKWAMAVRGEHYNDANGVIIPTHTANGFQTTGASFNIDYMPHANAMCRIEARWFNSKDPIFPRGANLLNNDFFIIGSIAIKLERN